MKLRNTIIIAVIFVLLAGFYYVYDVRLKPKREEKAKLEDKLFNVEKSRVVLLEVVGRDLNLSFEKVKDRWILTKPYKALASNTEIDSFLGQTLDLKKERILEENPKDVGPYNLKQPPWTIKIKTGGNPAAEYVLELGDKNPSAQSYFAREKGKPAVFLVSSGFGYYFNKKVEDFREREPIPFDVTDVTGFSLVSGLVQLDVEKAGDRWKIMRPQVAKADGEKVSNFLWDIKGIKARRFIPEEETKADLGFSNPSIRLVIRQKDKEPEELLVGKMEKREKERNLFCLRTREKEAFTIEETAAKKLEKRFDDFLDKHLLSFEIKDVTKIEARSEEVEILAEKEKEDWKIRKPDFGKNTPPSAGSLLWRFKELKFEKRMPGSDRASAGLDKPVITATLWKGKDRIGTFLFGSKEKKFFAQVEPSSQIYSVSEESYKTLKGQLDSFKPPKKEEPKAKEPGKEEKKSK